MLNAKTFILVRRKYFQAQVACLLKVFHAVQTAAHPDLDGTGDVKESFLNCPAKDGSVVFGWYLARLFPPLFSRYKTQRNKRANVSNPQRRVFVTGAPSSYLRLNTARTPCIGCMVFIGYSILNRSFNLE
jgi:hypothetical protein